MCLRVWMYFLNHCFSSASGFLFPRKSHYDASSPGPMEKQMDQVPGKWPLSSPPAPDDPSPVSPFPALVHKGQSWTFWELQVHTLNSWKGGNYEWPRFCDHVTQIPFSGHSCHLLRDTCDSIYSWPKWARKTSHLNILNLTIFSLQPRPFSE